jgi:hypothetical protein
VSRLVINGKKKNPEERFPQSQKSQKHTVKMTDMSLPDRSGLFMWSFKRCLLDVRSMAIPTLVC